MLKVVYLTIWTMSIIQATPLRPLQGIEMGRNMLDALEFKQKENFRTMKIFLANTHFEKKNFLGTNTSFVVLVRDGKYCLECMHRT